MVKVITINLQTEGFEVQFCDRLEFLLNQKVGNARLVSVFEHKHYIYTVIIQE